MLLSGSGSASAPPWTAGGSDGGRCRIISSDGSTGDDREIGRLVGARAGADVHDGSGVAERRPNHPRDPRVGATCLGVCAADSVVENVLDERSLVRDRLSSEIVPRKPDYDGGSLAVFAVQRPGEDGGGEREERHDHVELELFPFRAGDCHYVTACHRTSLTHGQASKSAAELPRKIVTPGSSSGIASSLTLVRLRPCRGCGGCRLADDAAIAARFTVEWEAADGGGRLSLDAGFAIG
jgi:hypothetical protein